MLRYDHTLLQAVQLQGTRLLPNVTFR